jgi:glucokinase
VNDPPRAAEFGFGGKGRGVTVFPVVLGLDYGGSKVAAALCDPAGSRLATTVVDITESDGAQGCFARGVAAGRELVDALPGAELVAVGACTFGIPFDDQVALAPNIPDWGRIEFGNELRKAFPGLEVRLATDVKAAAMAELRWGALQGCDPAIYLNLGTGLAVAIAVGGSVVNGHHGAAGEIAYNVRRTGDVGLGLGRRQTLEDVVSGKALARLATHRTGEPMGARDVIAAAGSSGDLAAVFEDFAVELCLHVANLAIALDAERIAVGGGMVRSWDRLGPRLREALDAAVPYPPELVVARFPFDAPLVGALALGIEAAGAGLGVGVGVAP